MATWIAQKLRRWSDCNAWQVNSVQSSRSSHGLTYFVPSRLVSDFQVAIWIATRLSFCCLSMGLLGLQCLYNAVPFLRVAQSIQALPLKDAIVSWDWTDLCLCKGWRPLKQVGLRPFFTASGNRRKQEIWKQSNHILLPAVLWSSLRIDSYSSFHRLTKQGLQRRRVDVAPQKSRSAKRPVIQACWLGICLGRNSRKRY